MRRSRPSLLGLLLLPLAAAPLASQEVVSEQLFAASPDILFTRIHDVIRLPGGRIVAADPGESRLTLFNPDGTYLDRVGRPGAGPGEYRSIRGIWAMAGDSIGVWDSRNGRITILDEWGETARTFNPDFAATSGGANPDGLLAGYPDGHFVLAALGLGPDRGDGIRADRLVMQLYGPDGSFVRSLGEDFTFLRVQANGYGGPLPFSPYPWADVLGDDLLFTNGYFPEVRRFDRAGAETAIAVEGEPVELEEAWDQLESAAGERLDTWGRHLTREDRGKGGVPTLGRILLSDEGHLWVKAYDPTKDALPMRRGGVPPGGSWTVYDPEGTAVATVEMPEDFSPTAIAGDRIIGISWSPFDEQSVAAYRWSGVR